MGGEGKNEIDSWEMSSETSSYCVFQWAGCMRFNNGCSIRMKLSHSSLITFDEDVVQSYGIDVRNFDTKDSYLNSSCIEEGDSFYFWNWVFIVYWSFSISMLVIWAFVD